MTRVLWIPMKPRARPKQTDELSPRVVRIRSVAVEVTERPWSQAMIEAGVSSSPSFRPRAPVGSFPGDPDAAIRAQIESSGTDDLRLYTGTGGDPEDHGRRLTRGDHATS